MGAHFSEITVIADVVADAVFFQVREHLLFAAKLLGDLECFQDRAGVPLSSPDIVNLGHPGRFNEFPDEAGDVLTVDVVTYLLAFVSKDLVFAAFEIAFDEVGEEPMKFDAGVIGAGEASAAQAAGRHAEIATVFLDHHIPGNFGGSEQGMLALIDGEIFGDAVGVGRIGVVPAGFEFGERNCIWSVAINLVRGHVREGRFRAGATCGLKKVQRSDRIGIEVVEWDGCCPVVAGLCSRMHDRIGSDFLHEIQHSLPVPDIEFVVGVALDLAGQACLVPSRISLRTEEDRSLVVVHPVNLAPLPGEKKSDFRTNEAGGSGDEDFHGRKI